jgi:(p)ppGpp synthase/HD superfamily hydrolase
MKDFDTYKLIYSRAIGFARAAHHGQKRKWTGDDYVVHPIAVGFALYLDDEPAEVVMAGILHDVLEDTDKRPIDISLQFGYFVKDLVVELTDVYTTDAYPTCNRAWRKTAEADRLARVSASARRIKRADIADNAKTIELHDKGGFASVWLKEKAYLLSVL